MKNQFSQEPIDKMPNWGPYSKKYAGISKIVQETNTQGARFDCVVHPMKANSNQPVPNVTVPSNYHTWEALPDLSYYKYRYELEWKDQLYGDVAFVKMDENTICIRTEFVNETNQDQNCVLNFYNAIEYPFKKYTKLHLPEGGIYKEALEYDEYKYGTGRVWDTQNADGMHKGEFFDEKFINNIGLGDRVTAENIKHIDYSKSFGVDQNDSIIITIPIPHGIKNPVVGLRYQTTSEEVSEFETKVIVMDGKEENPRICYEDLWRLEAATELKFSYISLQTALASGENIRIHMNSLGKGGMELDCFILLEETKMYQVKTEELEYETKPKTTKMEDTRKYEYKEIGEKYNLTVFHPQITFREIKTGTLEDCMCSRLSQGDPTFDDVLEPFSRSFSRKKSDLGYFDNVLAHSIFLRKKEKKVIYALLWDGEEQCKYNEEEMEACYLRKWEEATKTSLLKEGEKYAFSVRLLETALITNIVYPLYRHGDYIKHHTPGKRWDSFYTWDSGFIGMGILEKEEKVAEYILKTYLAEKDNEDFAFLLHGSPVPVQIYLYLELLQKTNEKEKYVQYYEYLKKYFLFLAGKYEGSTTDPYETGLTTTYDYFYNSSGMDDLPAQKEMYRRELGGKCAPTISTSQLIRFAKILHMIASRMEEKISIHYKQDLQMYEEEIVLRTNALQTYSWNPESGYFAYVIHDEEGKPIEQLKTSEGENFNKGMDGIYPLIAGACTKEQEEILLQHIFNSEEMFTQVGISAVDQKASYFEKNGYWNGCVWYSHQWFIWKTMLDLGKGEEAFRIATTALESWKEEVEASYYTFEMMHIETKRGGWYHQFGGLSAPVLIWENAYYQVGNIQVGFECFINYYFYNEDKDSFQIDFHIENNKNTSPMILVVVADNKKKKITCDGMPCEYKKRNSGAIEIIIPENMTSGMILVE